MKKYVWITLCTLLLLPLAGNAAAKTDSLVNGTATVASADTANQALPFSTHQPSLTGHYLKLLAITFVLLILFWLSMKYMRKLQLGGDQQKNTRITVLSRQYLTSKHSIWLVVIAGQKYLLGVTDHSINLIDRLGPVSEQELENARQMPLPSFGNLLDKLHKSKS